MAGFNCISGNLVINSCLQKTTKKCTKIYNARVQLLNILRFCDVLVAATVVGFFLGYLGLISCFRQMSLEYFSCP